MTARSDKRFCGVVQGRVLRFLWNRSQPLEYRLPVDSGAIKTGNRCYCSSRKVPPSSLKVPLPLLDYCKLTYLYHNSS